jgi:hypothetical protein
MLLSEELLGAGSPFGPRQPVVRRPGELPMLGSSRERSQMALATLEEALWR